MSSTIDPNIDPYGYLGMIRNPDGSIRRVQEFAPVFKSSPDPMILIKDVPINQENNTSARLYLPRHALDSNPTKKLPLIVYYHGGGFVLCCASTFDNFCSEIAKEISSVIVSVDYRLAPEHRLPAAYDDCMEALHWIKSASDDWLTNHVDYSNCFLMGTSAGGNIVYHVGQRAVTCVDDLAPLEIKGLILHHPFFGGVQRCPSELRLANDKSFPPCVADIMWELSLPIDTDRDHEYCNPTVAVKLDILDSIKDRGWRVLVTGCGGDPMIDRQIELIKVLEGKGVNVVGKLSDGGCHGVEFFEESKAKFLYVVLKNFVLSL